MPSIILLLTILGLVLAQDPSLCPSDSGLVLSGSISLSSTSDLTSNSLIPTTQTTLVYNYTLQKPFNQQPRVVLSLTSFSCSPSLFLMFSAKPLPSTSLSTLSFLLRFYQRYTTWTLLRLGFLAEARTDIQADFYIIDTRELGTKIPSKAIEVVLPLGIVFSNPVAVYFLSGFELASINTTNEYSPFEVAVTGKSSNTSSITLVVSTVSASQVFSLIISYVAFENQTNYYTAGVLQFNSATASFLNAPVSLPTAIASINGLSGFLIANLNSAISFSATIVNTSLIQFNINPSTTYLNYQYFIVPDKGNLCYFCQTNKIQVNGTCVSQCPQGSPVNGTCSTCPEGQLWNGTQCVLRCTGGRIWNTTISICQCPSNLVWNGNSCISCPNGQVWNSTISQCACPNLNQIWNGYACEASQCQLNQVINIITLQCECSPEAHLSGTSCIMCTSTQTWNGSACVCPGTQTWNGTTCLSQSCPLPNMNWNATSSTCQCIASYYFNGVQCITCVGGMVFDSVDNQCKCITGFVWNGSQCIVPCNLPFVYSNGQCVCPSGTVNNNGNCQTTPTCSNGQTWNGTGCSAIACSVGFFWNGTACLQYVQACPINTYWNGIVCMPMSIACPSGSIWNGTYCSPTPSCPIGTYLSGTNCVYFPQLCLPSYSWNGTGCLAVGLAVSCSNQQIYNGTICVNVTCSQGRTWSVLLSQCICNSSSFWNGLTCLSCPSGQIWKSGECGCATGYFLVDSSCYSLQQVYCSFVGDTTWNGTHCICNPGFTASGVSCLCQGVVVNSTCNPCSHLAHSSLINGQCLCIQGYYLIFGECKSFPVNSNSTFCQPGTLLSNGICVPCSAGCLSCTSQSVCVQCRPQFTYNWATYACNEICGDGLRFTLACDDGNNINGDGCSSDCKVESSFTCFGGSPSSKDICTPFLPSKMTVSLTGTSHLYGVLIVNLKVNYLPANLTDPTAPCLDLCQQLLLVTVARGFNSYISIATKYFPGTLSFSSEISFGREPIGPFTLSVSINPTMSSIYFPEVPAKDSYEFIVNPAFLSIYSGQDKLE